MLEKAAAPQCQLLPPAFPKADRPQSTSFGRSERRDLVESGPAAIGKADSVSGRRTMRLCFPKRIHFEDRSWQGPRRERGPFRNV